MQIERRRRVVHILVGGPRGGAESMAVSLAAAQRDAGIDARVLTLRPGPVSADLAGRGVAHVCAPSAGLSRRSPFQRVLDDWTDMPGTVVHTHSARPLALVATSRVRRRARPIVVFTRHGPPALAGTGAARLGAFRSHAEDLLIGTCASVACVNEDLWRRDRVRFPRVPVALIPNGIDTDEFRPVGSDDERRRLRTSLDIPFSRPLVVCAGRLVRIKGLHVLVDAWQRVSAVRPDAQLAIAGEGVERSRLAAQVESLHLGDSVRWFGSVGDVASLCRSSDAFVFPSIAGCLGRSALEALACGVPLVASDLSGTRTFVTDDEHALLVPPGNAAALASAILRLLDDRPRRVRLGTAGRRLAMARYALPTMHRAYEQLYIGAAEYLKEP